MNVKYVVGLLKKWQLIFYGTSEPPVRLMPRKKNSNNQIQAKTKLKHNEKEVCYKTELHWYWVWRHPCASNDTYRFDYDLHFRE